MTKICNLLNIVLYYSWVGHMEIRRDRYLNKLIEMIGKDLVKIIVGLRRCGKSYLLLTLFKNYLLNNVTDENHIIEINFDLQENEHLREPHACFNYLMSKIIDDGHYFFLLDEIQLVDGFEPILNSLLRKNADIYVTGSNSKMLSKDVVTEFRGRGRVINMYPLSLMEYKSTRPNDDPNIVLLDYLLYGGMPYITMLDTPAKKIQYLKDLYIETYIKDIIERNNLKTNGTISEILSVLSSSVGSFSNVHKIASTFLSVDKKNISDQTISKYISLLEDAFILYSAKRYDIKGRKYIGSNSKYYFADCGLRNAAIDFRQKDLGHLMEQVIYIELLSRGYSVDVGVVEERTAKNRTPSYEVDFVCNLGSERLYIQSVYNLFDEEKAEREIRPFRCINDSFKKIIIRGTRFPLGYDNDGVLHMGLFDFLEKDTEGFF